MLLVDSASVFRGLHRFTVTLAVGAGPSVLFTCCCGCVFKTVLQSMLQSRIFAQCILRLEVQIQETYFLQHAVCDWFASQHWAGEIALISRSPCSVLDHSPRLSNGAPAPMVYSPYQLQYMYGNGPVILNIVVMWYSPAIRTKSLKKYCSYMSLLLPANIPLRFCKHQYMCKKYGNILLFIYYIGIWFSTGIYRLTLVIKHWNKIAFIYKMWQTGPEISWIRMFCVFIVI